MTRRELILFRVFIVVLIIAAMSVYGFFRANRYTSLITQADELKTRIADLATARSDAEARVRRFSVRSQLLSDITAYTYANADTGPYEFADLVNTDIMNAGLTVSKLTVRESRYPTVKFETEGVVTDILRLLRQVEDEKITWIIESFSIEDINSDGMANCALLIGYRSDYEPSR